MHNREMAHKAETWHLGHVFGLYSNQCEVRIVIQTRYL